VPRRLIFSRAVLLTVMGGSRPRGPGFQASFVGAATGVAFLFPFLILTGDTDGGGGIIDVTPAQVFGWLVVGTDRVMSFSVRKMLSNFTIWRFVDASSRTVGKPSRMAILIRSS
jgi:hypothetical protein